MDRLMNSMYLNFQGAIDRVGPQHPTCTETEEEQPMTNTQAKSAIVTGASRGIGRSIATRLAKDGFSVAVNYAGGSQEAEEVVKEIKAAGGNALAIAGDISK